MKIFSQRRHNRRAGYASRIRSFAHEFSADYWRFFAAAFCMDLGFGLFFFLFSLYLTDLHFDERFIGHQIACLTLGNVVGTFPSMYIARRKGLRPLLLTTFVMVPIICTLRVLMMWPAAQMTLAFLTGAALCGWPICFSPALAALTDEKSRATGFSIAFATGIGLGSVSGIAGGYIPEILNHSKLDLPVVDGIRLVLLLSCFVTALGVLPLRRLSLGHDSIPTDRRTRLIHPYLKRFLPGFVLWNVVTGSFPIFGAVYLQKSLGMPLGRVGSVFSASQLAQFTAVALSPMLFNRMGIAKGLAAAQIGTALWLVLMAGTKSAPFVICFYLLYFATQFMCGPGIYSLLMSNISEEERSSASAVQNLSGALSQAGTGALTGIAIVSLGYQKVLIANAAVAVLAGLSFYILGRKTSPTEATSFSSPTTATPEDESLEACTELCIRQVAE